MKLVKAMTVLVIVLCSVLTAAPPKKDPGRRDGPGDANRLTGILQAVDAKHATFALDKIGIDVDEALSQRLKERRAADPQHDGETLTVSTSAKTKIYIKFRSSPSVANNLELGLKDLEPMVGYPVTVEVARSGERPVAGTVIAWRGTPWKVSK
jgi:hypothetical protein